VRFEKFVRIEMFQSTLEFFILFAGLHRAPAHFPLEFH
jgi:hypothetical protein